MILIQEQLSNFSNDRARKLLEHEGGQLFRVGVSKGGCSGWNYEISTAEEAASDDTVFQGGRILHSSPRNVSTKGSFIALCGNRVNTLVQGGIPPAWNAGSLVLVNFKHGKITCVDAKKAAARIDQGRGKVPDGRRRWIFNLSNAAEVTWQP